MLLPNLLHNLLQNHHVDFTGEAPDSSDVFINYQTLRRQDFETKQRSAKIFAFFIILLDVSTRVQRGLLVKCRNVFTIIYMNFKKDYFFKYF